MKAMKASRAALAAGFVMAAACAWGQSLVLQDRFRQAVKGAFEEAQAGLAVSPIPRDAPVAVLPIAGDTDGWMGGLLKNALTGAGKTCVETRGDAEWQAALSEIGWDARKEDILDPDTVDRLEAKKPQGAKILMTAVVRSMDYTERYAYFEVELHATEVATKRHLWGGVFAKRQYVPGVEGVGRADEIPTEFRQALQDQLRKQLAESLNGAKAPRGIGSVAVLPLATDVKGYVGSLVRDALTRTRVRPVNLGVETLAEGRLALRDAAPAADALLWGTLRELSFSVSKASPATQETKYRAELQLCIETADGATPWSETFMVEKGVTEWDAREQHAYQRAFREACDSVRQALADAPIAADVPVAILPIHGDVDGWMSGQLKIALTSAGKNCVEGKEDPMLKAILDEIEWDERKSDILDPETLDLIAAKKLQSAKVLLTAHVDFVEDRRGRPAAEMVLHATEIATKRHIWGGNFPDENGRPLPGPVPNPGTDSDKVTVESCPLNVGIEIRPEPGAEREGELLDTYVQGVLSDLRYRVGSGKNDDLTLELVPSSEVAAQTANSWIYKGEVRARLVVRGGDARALGAATLSGQGERAWDRRDAHTSLAHALEDQLAGWLRRTLNPDAIEFAAVRLEMVLAYRIEASGDYTAISEIQQALASLDGVRSAEVVGQDNRAGSVTFKVVYEKARLPMGVWNTLMSKHPEIVDNYLK